MSGETPVQMSAADAANAIGQLVNTFKGLRRADELIAYLQALDQSIVEKTAQVAQHETTVADAAARASAAADRAAAAEADSAARVQRAKDAAAGAETDSHRRIALAQAEADGLIASSRADADRQVEEIAAVIAARRGELAEINTQLDEARSALAAIRARLG